MGNINPKTRPIIYARDGKMCQYCGTTDGRMCLDHILPEAFGGVGEPYNLTVACYPCNQRKSAQIWFPRNFDAITADYPEWRAHVLAIAADPSAAKRQPVPSGNRRTYILMLSLNDDELAQVTRAAKKQYIDRAAWARQQLLLAAEQRR